MLLKTDEADKALNITENKTNSITDISFLKYCLDLGLLRLSSWEFFLNITKKDFSKQLVLEEISVRSDSKCLGNNNSV